MLFKPVKVKTTTGVRKNKKTTTTTVWVKKAGPTATLHRDPSTGNAGLLDAHKGKIPAGWKVLPVPARTVVDHAARSRAPSSARVTTQGVPPVGLTDYYLFKNGSYPDNQYATNGKYPNITGSELNLSGTRQDFDPSSGDPIVLLSFKGKGNKAFAQVTKNEAVRGSILKVPQHFAIVLDNEIRSWPQIDYTLYPNGIDPTGTGAQITGHVEL